MGCRVLVAGPSSALQAVRRALPEAEVTPTSSSLDLSLDPAKLHDVDALVVGTLTDELGEPWLALAARVPVVQLLLEEPVDPPSMAPGVTPVAHLGNPGELRLAFRTAVLESRVQRLVAELSGEWAHDARGALGVARLALELLKGSGDPAGLQKIENGVTRLGWLLERLPSQVALALDLPLAERTAPSLFPNLDSYVKHLQRIHSRRPIELLGGDWSASAPSQNLVPFAAAFAELAFKLSSARGKVRFSPHGERGLEVECEDLARPPPWSVPATLGASELCRQREPAWPYRLVEAARLAIRSGIPLTIDFTERGFVARVSLGERSLAP